MIIIPKEKPVLENLNSYYLNLERLCEHYQGEIGSGCIHFRSLDFNGLIFFDKDEILNGIIDSKAGETTGMRAAHRLLELAAENNFSVSLYKIESEGVYFWASIPSAQKIYSALSTEFTDLKGLIKKMGSEKLTGYIDVSIGNGEEGGILFFNNGVSIGGSYSWAAGEKDDTRESQERLIQRTKESGGTFDVSRIPPPAAAMSSPRAAQPEKAELLLPALEEFLVTFETCVSAAKKPRLQFVPLLKRKFVQQAERFPFLDPFVAEFEYVDQKIVYEGTVDGKTLSGGVLECCRQMAEEIGVLADFQERLAPWYKKYGGRFSALGLSF